MKKILERVVNFVGRAYRWMTDLFLGLPWRKIYRISSIALLVVAIAGGLYVAADRSYSRGYEQGERAGQCQVGCVMMGAEYSSHDPEDGQCWCTNETQTYYFMIPFKKQDEF